MKNTDSPRWCGTCRAYGDHHTDRHPGTPPSNTVRINGRDVVIPRRPR